MRKCQVEKSSSKRTQRSRWGRWRIALWASNSNEMCTSDAILRKLVGSSPLESRQPPVAVWSTPTALRITREALAGPGGHADFVFVSSDQCRPLPARPRDPRGARPARRPDSLL
eukprot:scaffold51138_cov60-Phaeocystis_antarctica.AAC.5